MASDCDILTEDGQPIIMEQPTAVTVDGYYPLYLSQTESNAAGDGSSHTHVFGGTTYYMPNGVEFWHGDFDGIVDPDELIIEHCYVPVDLQTSEFRSSGPISFREYESNQGLLDFINELNPDFDTAQLGAMIDEMNTIGIYKSDGTNFTKSDVDFSEFYGMYYALGPEITVTAGYKGWTDVAWDLTATMEDGGDIPNTGLSYTYEVATDASMTNIVHAETSQVLPVTYAYRQAAPQSEYWLRVGYTVDQSGLSLKRPPVMNTTNPCSDFSVVDSGDKLVVTSPPGTTVTVMQDKTADSRLLGVTRRIADDQFNNLFITTSQGAILDENGVYNPTGRAVFDGGWPRWYSYKEMYNGEQRDSTTTYGSGFTEENYGGPARWTRTDRDNLLAGEDIYDSMLFDGQFAYLHNIFNYVRRTVNPTNRMLYINDMHGYKSYGPDKFWGTVRDIGEYAGLATEQLRNTTRGDNEYWGFPSNSHYYELTNSSRTESDWVSYFEQFDVIAWFATSWTYYTLPQTVINAMRTYFNNGGGLFVPTDHSGIYELGPIGTGFQNIGNQLIYPWFGVYFTGKIDRTPGNNAYKIQTILDNTNYIPSGWHPLFDKIDPSSYIHAGSSEGAIYYDGAQSTTTSAVVGSSGEVEIAVGGSDTVKQLYVTTSNDCSQQITR